MSGVAKVEQLPQCSFCDEEARYDGKTTHSLWAYMCPTHWRAYGIKLGTGYGQRLVLTKEDTR